MRDEIETGREPAVSEKADRGNVARGARRGSAPLGRPLAINDEEAPEAVPEMVTMRPRQAALVADNVGIRMARKDGNRLRLFAKRNGMTLGEAIGWLLDAASVPADGRRFIDDA